MNPTLKSILLVIIALTVSACNNTKTDTTIDNSHGTVDKKVTIKSLTLKSNATTVNVAEHIELSVIGTYLDGSNKAINKNITYTITPNDSAEINNTTLTAKKDGNVTVQAMVNGVKSNSINLSIITWIVNGHVLPPEPDPAVNNATLLGVDVNDNGVRDDVERKVYATYPKAIERAVMMQAFKVKQEMLADSELVKNARAWHKKITKYFYCSSYLSTYKNQKMITKKDAKKTVNWQFNTEKRVEKYFKYDRALSGGVFSIKDGILQDCEFDVEKVLKMDK